MFSHTLLFYSSIFENNIFIRIPMGKSGKCLTVNGTPEAIVCDDIEMLDIEPEDQDID